MTNNSTDLPRRPCIEPACPRLAVGGRRGARCVDCQRLRTAALNRRKPNAYRERGYARQREIWRGARCWICGLVGSDTVDHVVPLSRGGTNDPRNLRPAHRWCNTSRGGREHETHEGVTRMNTPREKFRN